MGLLSLSIFHGTRHSNPTNHMIREKKRLFKSPNVYVEDGTAVRYKLLTFGYKTMGAPRVWDNTFGKFWEASNNSWLTPNKDSDETRGPTRNLVIRPKCEFLSGIEQDAQREALGSRAAGARFSLLSFFILLFSVYCHVIVINGVNHCSVLFSWWLLNYTPKVHKQNKNTSDVRHKQLQSKTIKFFWKIHMQCNLYCISCSDVLSNRTLLMMKWWKML